MLDTTLRPICFGLPKEVTPEAAKAVGPVAFKKYEHALYVCAQLSRIVYCDSGIMWHVIRDSFGLNNDEVNNTITKYDKQFADKRRIAVTSQPGEPGNTGRPSESYSLVASDGSNPYGIYISSPSDCTVILVKGSALKPNDNSIFQSTDVFVSFKGSSTMKNFKHDLMSQFSAGELRSLAGAVMTKDVGNVPLAFVKPIMKVWTALMKALETLITDGCRLVLTGHSLGGAFTSLFAFILAEAKVQNTIPVLSKVNSIHVVSFGAPTILSDQARNEFNKHLDSGLITFDRVVSQAVAARSSATQVLVGGIMGPNDVIPNIPVGFAHPGFRPLATEFRPEANGRPYQMMNIRSYYGAASKTNGREPTTWPFPNMTEPAPQTPIDTAELAEVKVQTDQEGGSMADFGKYKAEYATQTKNHLPNFVSVQGSKYAAGFAHAEYLGMFFLGGFRLPGMKNPASTSLAYFLLNDAGVKITYLPTQDRAVPGQEGGRRRKTHKGKHRKNRKTRRN
jgi:hypothetical protein